jgi:membrane protease YdiL (CAAX protease family)
LSGKGDFSYFVGRLLGQVNLVMKEFVGYLRNPVEQLTPEKSWLQVLASMILLLVLSLFLSVTAVLLVELLQQTGVMPEYTQSPTERVSSMQDSLLYAMILFPIMEELAFRLYLKPTRVNVSVSSFLLTYMLISNFVFHTSSFCETQLGLRLLISLVVAMGVDVLYRRPLKVRYGLLFYGSALLFGLVHIYHYDYAKPQVLVVAVLLCAPQILSGVVLGYTRVKYGIIGSIVLHACHNGLPMLLLP